MRKKLNRTMALLLAALTVLSMSGMTAFADAELSTTPPIVEDGATEETPSDAITPPGIIDEIPSNPEGETPSEPESEGEAPVAPEQQPEPLPEENTPSQPEALPEDEPAAQPEAELEVPMAELTAVNNPIDNEVALRKALEVGGTVKLDDNIEAKSDLNISKSVILDLNGHALSAPAVLVDGSDVELIIKDEQAKTAPQVSDDYTVTYIAGKLEVKKEVIAANGAQITLESGIVSSTTNIALFAMGDKTGSELIPSVVTVNGGYVIAQEFAISAQGKGATIHFNGGVAEARDNAVIAGNGSTGYGGTIINITGGTLIGHIQSPGYASCGVYHPQQGILNISGGTIYSENGCGILMRGGELNLTGGSIIAEGDAEATGKVGDSRVVVSTSGVIFDADANYYDKENVNVEISGSASVSGSKSSVAVISNNDASKEQITITGGTYNKSPDEFVAEGKTEVAITRSSRTVYAVGESIPEVVKEAQPGDTISVLKGDDVSGIPEGVTVKNETGSDITVNGVTVPNGEKIEAPASSTSSSSSDGGKSFAQRNSDFWEEVRQSIEDAKDGDVIKVNAKNYDRMSWTVMRELERNEGVSLVIRWNGGEEIVIPAGKAQSSESTRIYWPLSMLEELYAEASLTAPETGKPSTPDKANPSTGR